MKNFYYAENETVNEVGNRIKRQILANSDELMMVRVDFEKDAVGYKHQHPHLQVTFVVSGVFFVTIDSQIQKLKKGDSFFCQSDVEHGVVCVEAGTLIDVFNPGRKDFL